MPRGGARPGAGRKPKPAQLTEITDPAEFLQAVMVGRIVPSVAQLDAAKALLRVQSTGKKAMTVDRAKEAAKGRFAPQQPPKLATVAVLNAGRKSN